jgi:hypothetical protein
MISKGQDNLAFRPIWQLALIVAVALAASGCSQKNPVKDTGHLVSPYSRQLTIVVAPVLNYSGNQDLDPIKVTDILYSEMQSVEGFAVVPTNRMLAQLARERIGVIETPQQAMKIANALGADAIVVSAITEYNPFYPPVVGMAVQVYGLQQESVRIPKIDPVAMERSASPLKLSTEIEPQFWPKNQMQRIYNSRDKKIAHQVEEFAEDRGNAESPYKWEVYLRSQEYYLRFVCYKAIKELLDKELQRVNPGSVNNPADDVKEYN